MAERVGTRQRGPETKPHHGASEIKKGNVFTSMVSPVDKIFHLQRTIGNRAVTRLIEAGTPQARLTVGLPNDIYEKEADRVADRVMRMAAPEAGCPECTEPESVRRQVENEEEIQTSLQRQTEEEEEPIQAKAAVGRTTAVTSDLESGIRSLKGGGQPLPAAGRDFFEPRFGADFSRVRIHTGSSAAHIARSINARAFTTGRDVVFGAGQYSPRTSAGKKLLAHELTHVLQQTGSGGINRCRLFRKNSLIVQRRFIDRGMTGVGRVYFTGGTGGQGNQRTGNIHPLVNPVFMGDTVEGTEPVRASRVGRAWIRPRTGLVAVTRSFTGIRSGDQGGGRGRRWYYTNRAVARTNLHERLHIQSSRTLYRTHILPAERLANRHRDSGNAFKYGRTRRAAIAELRRRISWNTRMTRFRTADTAANREMGTVDRRDLASGTFPVDCRAGTVGGVHFDHRAHVPSEACPT